jgi:hypothetical protein
MWLFGAKKPQITAIPNLKFNYGDGREISKHLPFKP